MTSVVQLPQFVEVGGAERGADPVGQHQHPERIAAHPAASIALSATDTGAAWTIHIEPAGYRAVDGTHPATLTLAGSASDLYLLLWNRADVDRFEVRGDVGVLDAWRAKATIT